jgi:RNA polymerase sigma-70 factor (ECF subfamily)
MNLGLSYRRSSAFIRGQIGFVFARVRKSEIREHKRDTRSPIIEGLPLLGTSEATLAGNYYLNLNSNLTAEQEAVLEDHRLISGLQAGEDFAYEQLIERFQSPVYNLAYRLLNDQADASDVAQEVFLKIFRNVQNFRGDSSLRTWVYRIAVNESHNRRRWLFRHRRGETGIEDTFDDSESREKPLMDSGETPFDFTMNREAQVLLEEALAEINPVFRAALVLREVEDMSYEEIADILEVSIGTVKSRIVRGREALRRNLAAKLEPGAVQLVPRTAR